MGVTAVKPQESIPYPVQILPSLILMVVLGLACPFTTAAQEIADKCRAKIPRSLAELLIRRFPNYRLPLITDNLDEDIRFNIGKGGDGCLRIAAADFDGDGRKDFAVGLTSKNGRLPVVAIALAHRDTWLVSTVNGWVDSPMRLYVDSVPPGVYTRSKALDNPLAPAERQTLRCRTAGVVVGATESSGIVYCYANRRWLYVWASD